MWHSESRSFEIDSQTTSLGIEEETKHNPKVKKSENMIDIIELKISSDDEDDSS